MSMSVSSFSERGYLGRAVDEKLTNTLHVDLSYDRYIATLRGHVAPVYRLAWSADSRLLVSASKDSTVKVRVLGLCTTLEYILS